MSDSLYLSLWFPSFGEREMMPRVLAIFRQFPFSAAKPGFGYVGVHPISWNEAPIFEQTFDFRTDAEHVTQLAGEFLHDDYAYEFEAAWDLWTAKSDEPAKWILAPEAVRFTVHGPRFDGGIYQQQGNIMVDFGQDVAFLHEEAELDDAELHVRANVQKLVSFTTAVEKNCGISGRVLWSESEENLAQKLIARLQRVH